MNRPGTNDVSTVVQDRQRATVAGLCAGDAISWTSWWHRLSQLPPRRSVRLAEAIQHSRGLHATSLPTPYLQASPAGSIDPTGPTDDAEWFVVAVRYHRGELLDGSPATPERTVWTELAESRAADPGAVRARLGTIMALQNLAAGIPAPRSGHDSAHYFDDIACVRGVAAGLLRPGDPVAAAELAERDAEHTHALDGVAGSRATAALVSALLGGAGTGEAADAAEAQLPTDSWAAHVVAEAREAVAGLSGPLALAARLEQEVVDHVYPYANHVPETLGLLLAHLRAATSAEQVLLGALAHPRHADALVPLAGAVAGAAFGEHGGGHGAGGSTDLPVLTGASVRALAGVSLEDVLADLATAGGPVPAAHATTGGER